MEVECEIAEYVYDAFDVGAFQSLLKPIDEQRFAGFLAGRRAEKKENLYTLLRRGAKTMCPCRGLFGGEGRYGI